ncbi:hypothetical protein LSH36_196g08021 [Paralvinella palmiformis]|uniref:MYCBP-associated protein n=1 Tax=Paralvinella palmiformis TaxID=53620 RepID=A0AAD9JRB7_9ANNE|nr:hypothetical protein LSH36_196g08021 [Paralvinella palmiformis]
MSDGGSVVKSRGWKSLRIRSMVTHKLKKGRRDGTPEKPNTSNVSQDDLPEEGPAAEKKHVIINDEILALRIKPEDLEKLHEPKPPEEPKKSPVVHPVVVRKLKPASEWDKPKPKVVLVAKPAPPDAPLKPIDLSAGASLRFDTDGNIIPHSILGSVEQFKKEASQRGELPYELAVAETDKTAGGGLTVKYEKQPVSKYPKFESVNESNALMNWEKRMMERRKQQDHLSKLLNKAPDQLVMNQADSYRKTQELRYIIDRTIPTIDYGKGYRVGSEFWNQQERIGDDLTGIHMAMSQTEKGYPPPIEHVGVPSIVQQEKGTDWEKPRTPFHKPWHKSPYLRQRQVQLEPIIKELDPHEPDILNLEIVGTNQPEAKSVMDHPYDTELNGFEQQKQDYLDREHQAMLEPVNTDAGQDSQPVFGPSLIFSGRAARWTGDSSTFLGQKGVEARVSFEAFAGDRATTFLEIVNDGTTCIYYDWKKIPKIDPFEKMAAKIQRFYFNTSNGVILPGDRMKFPFVFKSPNAGVFSEQWHFETKPVLCGGASLLVTLRGVALQKDKFKNQRTEIEKELAHKQAEQIVHGVLDGIIEGLRHPERPRSPVDAYITEEEIFARKNPRLYYSNEVVQNLKALYKELFKKEEAEEEKAELREEPEKEVEWNLSVQEVEDKIMLLDEDDERKQEKLLQLNSAIISLSYPPFTPKQLQMFNMGYQLMTELVDDIVGEAVLLRTTIGMPERESIEIPDEAISSATGRKTPQASDHRIASSNTTGGATIQGVSRSSTRSDMKSPGSRDGKKKMAKDAKTTDKKPAGKDVKGSAKPATKETPAKAGKTAAAKGSSKPGSDRPTSGQSGTQSQQSTGDPILEAKYKQKLYTQAFILVSDVIDNMSTVFDQIQQLEGGPKLPALI